MIPEDKSGTRHPFMSLLNLIFLVLLGTILFSVFGFVVSFLIYGQSVLAGLRSGVFTIETLKIIQLFSSAGTFIFPAIMFARQQDSASFSYLRLSGRFDIRLVLLAIIILYASTPFIERTILINQQMKFPEFLQGLETWMREKEDQAELLTKQFLMMTSPSDLLINLLIIAVIPGIGEELLFRGCVQKLFAKWTKSPHLGIWIAAIIFSAIHVQFYGFIPRMLLGALFGYLFFWSKNLWIPIMAHFANNAFQVVMAYVLQRRGESIDVITKQPDNPMYYALISLLVTVFLLFVFKKVSVVKYQYEER